MKTNSTSKTLRYIVIIYGFIYFSLFVLIPLIVGNQGNEDMVPTKVELITVPLAFVIYALGTIYLWINEKWAGIMLLFWHFCVWALAMLFWRDAGMVLVLIFPMVFPAVLLIRNWYKKNDEKYTSEIGQWELVLKVLLINYAAIYVLVIFSNVVPKLMGWELITRVDDLAVWDYTSLLGILLLVLFAIFLLGFVISWKSELISGILFVVWYVFLVILNSIYPEFANSGPSNLFGLTILLQGVFQIVLFFKKKRLLKIS